MLYENTLKRLLSLLEIFKSKKIIVFGCSLGGKIVAIILKSLSIKVEYFVDNNSSKWNKKIMDIEVKNPIVLNKESKDNTLILIASQYYEEIVKQVVHMGFVEEYNVYNALSERTTIIKCNELIETTFFKQYGFSVGKYTYGYKQFFFNMLDWIKLEHFVLLLKM